METVKTVNPIILCSCRLQKETIQLEYFVFSNRKHFNYLCTIYTKSSKRKNFISVREIVRERLSTFRFRQHF